MKRFLKIDRRLLWGVVAIALGATGCDKAPWEKKSDETTPALSTGGQSTAPWISAAPIGPPYDFVGEPIQKFIASNPKASLKDVVAHINSSILTQAGIPAVFFLIDDQGKDAPFQPVLTTTGENAMWFRPSDNLNCGFKPYIVAAKSMTRDEVTVAIGGKFYSAKMPSTFTPGQLTTLGKDGKPISTVYASAMAWPSDVSDDGRTFYFQLFLTASPATKQWWKTASAGIPGTKPDAVFLVYGISEKGIEFTANPQHYKPADPVDPNAKSVQLPNKLGKVIRKLRNGLTLEHSNICMATNKTGK